MTLGLVARADQRGIGVMTAEFHKAMKPDKVLVVSHGEWSQDFAQYTETGWISVVGLNLNDLSLNEQTCRDFLEGLDVVYCVETLYDWRFKQWADDAGCRVVIHGMPELYSTRDHVLGRPQPDEWFWPTEWLLDEVPDGKILPVPTPDLCPTSAGYWDDERLRVLHVAGHAAIGDRNGTINFMEALQFIRRPVEVTVVGQDHWIPRVSVLSKHVDLHLIPDGIEDRWSMYAGQHVVVLPRRYGGLCLPAQEACRAGCATVMPDCIPNRTWPGDRIPARKGRLQHVPFGRIQTYDSDPRHIARAVDHYAHDRDHLKDDMIAAYTWGTANRWAMWRECYEEALS